MKHTPKDGDKTDLTFWLIIVIGKKTPIERKLRTWDVMDFVFCEVLQQI